MKLANDLDRQSPKWICEWSKDTRIFIEYHNISQGSLDEQINTKMHIKRGLILMAYVVLSG